MPEATPQLVKWKVGRIDAKWKRDIAKANERRAIDTINGLNAILFGGPVANPIDFEAQANALRGLSADEIADALIRYWRITQQELEQTDVAP